MPVPSADSTATPADSVRPRPQRGRRRAPKRKRGTGRRIAGILLPFAVLAGAGIAVFAVQHSAAKFSASDGTATDAPTVNIASASAASAGSVTDVLTGVDGAEAVFPVNLVQNAAPNTTLGLEQLTSGGLVRSYLVVAPKTITGDLPLIVVLPGQLASATEESLRTELLPLANSGKAILVYPAGYLESWNVGALGCCGESGKAGIDDASFISSVVGAVKGSFSITKGRVYLVGYSNGGKMAYSVMCQYPQLFRAFAAVSATPLAPCSASSPPPASALIMVGSADPELPISGKAQDAATVQAATAAIWRKNDSCSVNSQSASQGIATVTTWGACAQSTQVQTVLYAGAGHGWPLAIPASSTPSAATLIWDFFSSLSPST